MLENSLTIVVPFYNGYEYLPGLLWGLPGDIPMILVDDHSDVPLTMDRVKRPNTKIIRPEHKGYFTGAVNRGIEACTTDVLVLNQDVTLTGTAWLELVAENRNRFGFIGEKIKGVNPLFPHGYIHGVFQFMRRDVLDRVGLMDEKLYPLWGASALWQLQVCRAGIAVLPLDTIPGLTHLRQHKPFGSTIQATLDRFPEKRSTFVRTPPEISVVVPAYNHGKYLQDCVNSFIGGPTSLGEMSGQTFQSFEIIIVNDASPDNTREICQTLCNPWQGIRYVELPKNLGTAGAYNAGVRVALGKYIACISADDMREPWSLENLYKVSVENPHTLVYDNLRQFNHEGRGKIWQTLPYDFDVLLHKNMVPTGVMFEKRAWQAVGGYPEVLGKGREDWGFAIAMGRAGYCGIKLDEPGYLYRREGQNRTLRNTDKEWMEYFRGQMQMLFPDLYAGRYPMGCCGKKPKSSGTVFSKSYTVNGNGATLMAYPQAENMVLIEYVGGNVGSTRWGGMSVPSKRTYTFGANERDRRKLVENQDVAWFLARNGPDGRNLFRRVTVIAAQPSPEPVPQPIPQAGTTETQEMTALVAEITGESEIYTEADLTQPDLDPYNYTINEIKEMDLSVEMAQILLIREREGKNRSTLIDYLEELAHA